MMVHTVLLAIQIALLLHVNFRIGFLRTATFKLELCFRVMFIWRELTEFLQY